MQIPYVLADYLKGKDIYPSVRRSLNLLFSISITAFIFEKLYFTFSWPDISNYKLILDFFVRGHFIVPFSIFILVHGITHFIPFLFFSSYNYFKSIKLLKEIISYELKTSEVDKYSRYVSVLSSKLSPIKINREVIVELYLQIKEYLTPKQIDELQKECEKGQAIVQENFIFAFRALLATLIYFFALNYFGWVLLVITDVSLLLYMILMIYSYRFLDIIPVALRKFRYEADKYVDNYLKAQNQDSKK